MASAPVAAGVWFFTGNIWYVALSLFLGFLVDVDHVIDYIREERKFNFKDLFVKSYKGDFEKLYVIFHGWEYIALAWAGALITGAPEFGVVFTVSYLVHMIPDQLMNNVKPLGYSILYRWSKGWVMSEFFYTGRKDKCKGSKNEGRV